MANHTTSNETKRLYLSSTDRKLSGVCGGIAEYFKVDATLVRLAWLIMTVITGILPGLLAYIVAAVVIPESPAKTDDASTASGSKATK